MGRGGGGIDWRHDQVGRLGGLAVEEKDRGAERFIPLGPPSLVGTLTQAHQTFMAGWVPVPRRSPS